MFNFGRFEYVVRLSELRKASIFFFIFCKDVFEFMCVGVFFGG